MYGLDKLQVRTTGKGSDWWGQNIQKCVNMDYVHTNHLGSVTNLTDQFGRVAARSDYSDWGEVTAYDTITVDQGFRMLMPEVTYATHEYDDVLNQFYAKARMYDAENKRFTAMDTEKGHVAEPMGLIKYIYVQDNPLKYIDRLGLWKEITVDGKKYTAIRDIATMKGYGAPVWNPSTDDVYMNVG